ncbi:MAG TPA: multicopper oxidase domain-containing protein [Candidatus Methylomirabilis sp.]|nr:multicopper oxidase domain-containing protein [Candidatus Methylomirabilis sp.]
MLTYIIFQLLAGVIGVIAAIFVAKALFLIRKRTERGTRITLDIGVSMLVVAAVIYILAAIPLPLHFAMPPTMHAMTTDKQPASLPFVTAFDFLLKRNRFEKVADIGRDPNEVPQPLGRNESKTVKISVHAKEVIAEVAPGIYFNYWTYDGKVPGPMYRVRVGDTIELTLSNDKTSLHHHNIDLHAVNGPGGGAAVTMVEPGESKTFRWLAMNPGLYEYHCAAPNVSTHNSHGQYGLILVEPEGGLPPVDKEFYLMQGELYTMGGIGKRGLMAFDTKGLINGTPTYVTFNGKVEQAPRMHAKVGDRIRMFVGGGGVNLISSFHVIGEIFDVVYPEGAIGEGSAVLKNVQTTAVLPGGAAIVEFTLDVPGKYVIVDHALARMNKGAWAILDVTGDPQPNVYEALSPPSDMKGHMTDE